MPRRPRIFVPGLSVHVIHRGNNGIAVFHDDADRDLYLHYVREAMADNGVETHGFTLMSTHWHGLVTPSTETALQLAMKKIGERYVRYFNCKYDRFGTLWNDRYRALPVTDEIYWLTCLRYMNRIRFEPKWCRRSPLIAGRVIARMRSEKGTSGSPLTPCTGRLVEAMSNGSKRIARSAA
jgi:REP element-mobilizing transposase RayT